jgi:hypothetical protein
MTAPLTPASLAPVQMNLDPSTGGLPSFIQMEQKAQDKTAAEALNNGVSKKDKDGFASLIPKAFLMEANEADAETKMTSSSSEFGKYLADIAAKASLEQALAKAISTASCFDQLKSMFGKGSAWDSSDDSAVSSAANSVKNGVNAPITNPDNTQSYADSQHQQMYFSLSQQGADLNSAAQVKLTIKTHLDKMASEMQGDSGSISSLIANLSIHPV